MARYFLDSSALVKRYHQESGSAAVDGLFQGGGDRFFVSRLALVEVHSSSAQLVREGILTRSEFDKVILRLDEDVATGVLIVAAVSSHRLEEASQVLATYGLTSPVRTLDAIHLATAQALHAHSRIAAFVAADKKLLAAAAAGQLAVLDVS